MRESLLSSSGSPLWQGRHIPSIFCMGTVSSVRKHHFRSPGIIFWDVLLVYLNSTGGVKKKSRYLHKCGCGMPEMQEPNPQPQPTKCYSPLLHGSPVQVQALFAYLLSTYVLWSLWSAENIPAFGPKGKILLSNLHSRSLCRYFALPKGFPCTEGKRNIRAQIHQVYLKGKACFVAVLIAPVSKRRNARSKMQ